MRRLLFQSASQAMVLDALQGETFSIAMGTSIQSLHLKNVTPGMLYVFILKQNNAGSHTVQWGSNIRNGAAVDPMPFSVSVQTFIGDTGGILKANVPGTWR